MAASKLYVFFSLLISVVIAFQDGLDTRITHDSTEILSRQKRFFALKTAGWRLRCVNLSI